MTPVREQLGLSFAQEMRLGGGVCGARDWPGEVIGGCLKRPVAGACIKKGRGGLVGGRKLASPVPGASETSRIRQNMAHRPGLGGFVSGSMRSFGQP